MLDSLKLPAIVVVTYNRTESLKRLLNSIDRADYTGYENVPLVISVDKSDRSEVLDIATSFVWKHGKKEIIEHKSNLGLRKHILACGDLTERYGAVIVLEDDLLVSPAFYDYAVQAMNFYDNDSAVSGIALYSYDYNDWARVPFTPIDDGYDNYFFQCATSWGQMWTCQQWSGFKLWYASNSDLIINGEMGLPPSVINWPQTSWKKYFVAYTVTENKYFVYPRTSLTTNFGDAGTHVKVSSPEYQVSLMLRTKSYKFSHLEDSLCIYDVFYELEARCIKVFNQELEKFDFECDLYGTKNLENVRSDYLISIRECSAPSAAYSHIQMPQEFNILFDEKGDFFSLARTTDFREVNKRKQLSHLEYVSKGIDLTRSKALYFYILRNLLKRRFSSILTKFTSKLKSLKLRS